MEISKKVKSKWVKIHVKKYILQNKSIEKQL